MKRNFLLGFSILTLSLAGLSHADFSFHSSAENGCEFISGQWAGTGTSFNWLTGECGYHGTGNVSVASGSDNFTLDLTVDKDWGSFLCPGHVGRQLTGICTNGVVTILTDYGNLTGSFSDNAGNAAGTLTLSPGLNVDVAIQFKRAE